MLVRNWVGNISIRWVVHCSPSTVSPVSFSLSLSLGLRLPLSFRSLRPVNESELILLLKLVIVEWTSTLFENAQKLTGKRAGPEAHQVRPSSPFSTPTVSSTPTDIRPPRQRVAYLLTRFSPLIKGIQHLSVYASGDHFIVETDVVLPATTGLTRAHNCAESAQCTSSPFLSDGFVALKRSGGTILITSRY